MKTLFSILFILYGLPAFSQQKDSTMKNDIHLNIDYDGVSRMEAFLHQIKEPLRIVDFKWDQLELKEYIGAATKVVSSSDKPLTISIFFCTSYHEANEMAKANHFPYTPLAKWSVNGSLLYIVACEDSEKVSDILSLFAGKE